MKIRLGFVSNSSSASFSVNKKYLTPSQVQKIIDTFLRNIPIESSKEFTNDHPEYLDDWNMKEEEDYLRFTTFMDNFDLIYYLLNDLNIPHLALENFDSDNYSDVEEVIRDGESI